MQIRKTVAIMTLALFSHCVMTASSPSGPKYTAKPTPISTFANEFTLAVLAADSEGKIDLTKTDPLIRSPSNPANPSSLDLLFTAYANVKPTVFALKNQKLSAGNDVLGFAAPEIETTGYGYRSFLFNPSGKIFAEAVNFTAVPTSDSYGRSFLRLGTDGGKDNFIASIYYPGLILYKVGKPITDFEISVTIALRFD